jgi:4-diphosphocytidyl-2-C-methyl-D-erythritol kinase
VDDPVAISVAEQAHAKINLNLHVIGRQADGYHQLDTLVVFTRIGDVLRAEQAETDGFVIDGPFATGLATDAGNLVIRARDALRAHFHFPPVALALEKNLPVASGIGGGSADAAAALRALTRLLGLPKDAGGSLAPSLGADTLMCHASRSLRARNWQ